MTNEERSQRNRVTNANVKPGQASHDQDRREPDVGREDQFEQDPRHNVENRRWLMPIVGELGDGTQDRKEHYGTLLFVDPT